MRLLCFTIMLVAVGLWSPSLTIAQDDTSAAPADSIVTDTTVQVTVDTVAFIPAPENHPAARVNSTVNLEDHLYQNPTIALFKSMLVPGWGQFGNKSYIKAGIVVGLQTWFISSAIQRDGESDDAKQIFHDDPNPITFAAWDTKRKSRNQYIWMAGIVTFLSMFDAYVDAHLSGSPTNSNNDKFGFEITPTEKGGVAASLNYNF